MLIELLSLRLPHGRGQPGLTPERLELALVGEPRDLGGLRPDAPARLLRLLVRCLGSTPESRPTAVEVAKELRDTDLEPQGKLGPKDHSTDVDEPTIEELRRRLEVASASQGSERRIAAGGASVGPYTTASPVSSTQRSEEVFFVRRAVTTAPLADSGVIPDGPRDRPSAPLSSSSTRTTDDLTVPDGLPPFGGAETTGVDPPQRT